MTAPQTGRIFISYRRDDSAGYAGRIYDRLAAHFGKDSIFMDVDTIEAGLDFVEVLENAVQSCDVLVALIGRQWLNIKDEEGKRRLDNPQDFVRIEVAAALNRGIRVIPVLVDGTPMPRSDQLPDNLQSLARRNAVPVNHYSFHNDANRLIEQLELALKAAEESKFLKAKEQKEKEIQEKHQTKIENLLLQADIAFDLQDWKLAKEKLDAVLKLEPEHAQAQAKLDIVRRKLQESKEKAERDAAEQAEQEKTKKEAERVAKQKAEEERIAKAKAEAKRKSEERREQLARTQTALHKFFDKVIELPKKTIIGLQPPIRRLVNSRLAILTITGIVVLTVSIWGILKITNSIPRSVGPDFEESNLEIPATSSLTPKPTSTLTQTPIPIDIPSLAGTPVPSSPEKITLENADLVVQLARWGKGNINQLAYSQDGKLLLVASSIGLHSYDSNTLEELDFLESSLGFINQFDPPPVFSPNRSVLAVASSYDNVIRLWNVIDGTLIQNLEGNKQGIESIAFSLDGNILASARSNTIQLWNIDDGKLLQTMELGDDNIGIISGLTFSPDGTSLFSVTPFDLTTNLITNTYTISNAIRQWRINDGKLIQTHNFVGNPSLGFDIDFSRDGEKFAINLTNDSSAIHIVRIADGDLEKTIQEPTDGLKEFAFSPDGSILASASSDNTIRLWNIDDGVLIQTLTGHKSRISNMAFSPDGKRLVSGSHSGNIHLWRVSDGTLLQTITGYSSYSLEVAFSQDVQTLAYAAGDDTIPVWDIIDGVLLQTLEEDISASEKVSFSPDGQTLVSASSDNSISVWNVNDGTRLHTLEGHTQNVTSMAFSHDGTALVSGSDDKTVRLWDTSDGTLVRAFEDQHFFPKTKVQAVAISPNGQTIAAGMELGTVILWNTSDGTLLETIEVSSINITSLAFSPDGKTLAVGSDDSTLQLWNTDDITLLQTLEEHTGSVLSVTFSPDSQILVSGAEDNTIHLWNVNDGSLLKTLEGHTGSVNNVAFSINGQIIVSSSLDGTIRVWGIEK